MFNPNDMDDPAMDNELYKGSIVAFDEEAFDGEIVALKHELVNLPLEVVETSFSNTTWWDYMVCARDKREWVFFVRYWEIKRYVH